jgi:hypothetical protein
MAIKRSWIGLGRRSRTRINFMGKHYDNRISMLREKYGIRNGKLEFDRQEALHLLKEDTGPSRFVKERLSYLKSKFNLPDGLQLEGKEPAPRETTVEDLVISRNKEESKHFQLAYAHTEWKDKPFRIWFEVSRRR